MTGKSHLFYVLSKICQKPHSPFKGVLPLIFKFTFLCETLNVIYRLTQESEDFHTLMSINETRVKISRFSSIYYSSSSPNVSEIFLESYVKSNGFYIKKTHN